jgi:hypothetical protein
MSLLDQQHVIERPSLVLIIDAWNDRDNEQYRDCLLNIKNFCENNPYVAAIGLASYLSVDAFILPQEEPWYSQSRELFYQRLQWETLRQIWQQADFVNVSATHPIINNIKARPNQRQFLIWHNLQVLYYCNYINTAIENIYIVGTAWEACLYFRSVGYRELSSLNEVNMFSKKKTILSRKDCVLNPNDVLVEDITYPWKYLDNNTIILDPEFRIGSIG